MSQKIVLYDIPSSTPGVGASPNVWKARYALNVKGLPFETVWVEYPDIEAVCKEIGASPTRKRPDGGDHYTLPVIKDPSTNSVISDSYAIVRYLDNVYPSTPKLIPEGTTALQAAFVQACRSTFEGSLVYILLPASQATLNPPSAEYYRRSREAMFRMKLEEFSPIGPTREKHWAEAKGGFSQIASWLNQNGEEVLFASGESLIFVDVMLASYLHWMKSVFGEGSQEWKEIETWDGGRWRRLEQAFARYR